MSESRQDPNLERAIDALFDRELSEASQRELLGSLRRDPVACQEIAETRRAMALLNDTGACPDLTEAILASVNNRRRFVPASVRRFVTTGRAAIAAGILAAVSGYAAFQRHGPETSFTPTAAPVSDLVESAHADAAQGLRTVAGILTASADCEQAPAVASYVPSASELRALEARLVSSQWTVARAGSPTRVEVRTVALPADLPEASCLMLVGDAAWMPEVGVLPLWSDPALVRLRFRSPAPAAPAECSILTRDRAVSVP